MSNTNLCYVNPPQHPEAPTSASGYVPLQFGSLAGWPAAVITKGQDLTTKVVATTRKNLSEAYIFRSCTYPK